MTVEQRLAEIGLALPNPPVPVGNYRRHDCSSSAAYRSIV